MTKAIVTSEGLNLRSSGSMEGKVIDQLGYHDELEIISTRGKWLKVKHLKRGRVGYVYGDYVMIEQKPSPTVKVDPKEPELSPSIPIEVWVVFGILVAAGGATWWFYG